MATPMHWVTQSVRPAYSAVASAWAGFLSSSSLGNLRNLSLHPARTSQGAHCPRLGRPLAEAGAVLRRKVAQVKKTVLLRHLAHTGSGNAG